MQITLTKGTGQRSVQGNSVTWGADYCYKYDKKPGRKPRSGSIETSHSRKHET